MDIYICVCARVCVCKLKPQYVNKVILEPHLSDHGQLQDEAGEAEEKEEDLTTTAPTHYSWKHVDDRGHDHLHSNKLTNSDNVDTLTNSTCRRVNILFFASFWM